MNAVETISRIISFFPPHQHQQVRLVLAGTLLGLFVSAVNSTVVSTALPRIIGELGGLNMFSWVFTSYMLTATATVPLVGKLGDTYGRKPFFMAGIAVFMAGSALSGLSQDMTQLIIFRGLQGFGVGVGRGAVDVLVRLGLVARHEDVVDRRIKRIVLTAAGRDRIVRLNAARRDTLRQFIATLSEAEREQVTAALAPILARPDVHAFLQELPR